MKNLSPHRKFRGAVTIQPTVRPYYNLPWPGDLPSQCQICGTQFRSGWNLSIGKNRLGRSLKQWAYISFFPCWLAIPAVLFLLPHWFNQFDFEGILWVFFVILMLVASPLMFLLSLVMPTSRHVQCKKCGWSRDFPI